jgi:LysR family glycine cleavage system transcriptional activator
MRPSSGRRRLPPLNALRAFEAAARHGSFKEAAEELHVSQSAISHQIKGLESYLGIELFLRKTRAVELTRSGKTYYPILRDAFERIVEGTELIRTPLARGAVTLQVYSSFTVRWLIRRLPGFQKEHPELQLRLCTAQEDVDFSRDDVDACIMIGQPIGSGVHYDFLFACQMFPVCSPGLLETLGPITTPAELAPGTLLQVYPSERDWRLWLQAQGLHDINPDAGLRFDSYDLAYTAALQGMGIALGQQPYIGSELAAGLLVEIFPGARVDNPNKWYFACREEKSRQPGIETLRQWLLREVAADTSLVR